MYILSVYCKGFIANADKQVFHEQWVLGTYVVLGVFPIMTFENSVNYIESNISNLMSELKKHKKGKWIRGICGYYAVPIYISSTFEDSVIEWVRNRPGYRWAIWHEPILYDYKQNRAYYKEKRGLHCLAYKPFLFEVVEKSLEANILSCGRLFQKVA